MQKSLETESFMLIIMVPSNANSHRGSRRFSLRTQAFLVLRSGLQQASHEPPGRMVSKTQI
jgi:hypothetical protein